MGRRGSRWEQLYTSVTTGVGIGVGNGASLRTNGATLIASMRHQTGEHEEPTITIDHTHKLTTRAEQVKIDGAKTQQIY